jgi:UDPglucose 6-dehydrogenase
MYKINIVGVGYVGLANGLALAKNNEVNFIDSDISKVEKLQNKISPILEKDISDALVKYHKNLTFFQEYSNLGSDCLHLLCLPTNYNEQTNELDTGILEKELDKILSLNKKNQIVIKSTVPIGFTSRLQKRYPKSPIYFSPEFLREGSSFKDATNPERLIISPNTQYSKKILKVLSSGEVKISKENLLALESSEAESVKLFSNAYLAMRVAFFNEVDNFCISNNLSTEEIINGISKDSRIGQGYNNPSFGYGGYCLPKDTKQAESLFDSDLQKLLTATIRSNQDRIKYIAKIILKKCNKNVGIFRLQMKSNSDNFRLSSTVELINCLKKQAHQIIIYEPLCSSDLFPDDSNIIFMEDIRIFEEMSDLIVANRTDLDYKFKKEVFTRDIFNSN